MAAQTSTDDIALEPTNCEVCHSNKKVPEATGRNYLYGNSQQEFHFVTCAECGHLYLDPRPRPDQVSRLYPPIYPSFSGRFSEKGSLIARIKDHVLASRFKQLGEVPTNMRLIDIGCGDGAFLISLRRLFPEAELTGLDWHFPEHTRALLESHDIGMIEGTLETVELPVDHYDVVVMNQLIEHLWDPNGSLDRCRTAMKPGGKIAIETPNQDGYDRKYWFRDGAWGSYYYPRHFNLFSTSGLRRLVENHGFVVETQSPLLAPPCWAYTMISLKVRKGWNIPLFDRFVRDNNLLVLAIFAGIDVIARMLGQTTSNQKLVARRPI
jgi:SAM-dependent methyltransferase